MLAAADLRLYRALRVPPAGEQAMRAFSRFGEHGAGWLALGAGGAALDRQRRGEWLNGLMTVAGAYAVNVAVKAVVRRRRPVVEGFPALVPTPTQLSFPSSHATSSFAAARAYGQILPAAPLYVLAAAMALSRIALGVHHPSDVAAGAVLGMLLAGAVR